MSHAQLKQFNIILPRSWSGTDCALSANTEYSVSGAKPDVVISGMDLENKERRFHHHSVRSVQYGQCGTAGIKVDLPFSALMANRTVDDALVDSMTKEFIKYRFGVFEESGFEGDRLYPQTFVEGNEKMINKPCEDDNEQVIQIFNYIYCLL